MVRSGSKKQILVGSLAALTVLMAYSAAAQTPARPDTAPGQDPRRAGGAKITTDPSPPSTIEDSDDPEQLADRYQPKGITLGKFLILPKVEIDQTYNDNIYATEQDEKGDFITLLRPEVNIRLREPLYSLNSGIMLEAKRHGRYNDDDSVEGRFFADGKYEINRELEASGGYSFSALNEERGSSNDVEGKEPTKVQINEGRLGGKFRQGRYTFGIDGTVTHRQHDNVMTSAGTMLDNSDRDRTEALLSTRASYEIFPGYAAVLAVSANDRSYDRSQDRAGFKRSSQGYRIEGGIGVDVAQTLRGDFVVGYLSQDYEDRRYEDPAGLAFRASFNWTPSRLTLVVPTIERTVQETTLLGASSMIRTSASLLVRHEYARNILLTGFGGVYYDDLQGLNRDSVLYEIRGRVTYAFNENFFVSGELGHRTKDSELNNRSFSQNFIGLRLGVQM